MLSTPSTAPVGSPRELDNGGNAWKARYKYDEPSTRSNLRAGMRGRGSQACGPGFGVAFVSGAATGGAAFWAGPAAPSGADAGADAGAAGRGGPSGVAGGGPT